MSDNEDLFADSDGDSDDTDELLNRSRLQKKKAAPKKAAAAVPSKITATSKASKDTSDGHDSDKGGLFDSDSEDEEEESPKKAKKKALSKREKLEQLAKKRNRPSASQAAAASAKRSSKGDAEASKTEKGYDSGDSYDSGDFARTKEDDDFLDTTGEDADAVQELYKEQHFDDERPENEETGMVKKKRRIRYDDDDRGPRDDTRVSGEEVPDNPIMAAVHKMKKKKQQKKSLTEIEDVAKEFLGRMQLAAEDDEAAVAERRPATAKLAMLQETVDMLTNRDMQRMLIEFDLLSICRRWIQPLPNGTLGNVTVRQKLLQAIAKMSSSGGDGESSSSGIITSNDLKRSDFGKAVMVLFKHRSETPEMKRLLKSLIEQWSRPIFQKSGNMRDLGRVSRGQSGLAAVAAAARNPGRAVNPARKEETAASLDVLIKSGKRSGAGESGITRVRVPFSKGFAFSVRPEDRHTADMGSPQQQQMARKDTRGKLSKRMLEKGRAVSKNQRSANISIEGRPTK